MSGARWLRSSDLRVLRLRDGHEGHGNGIGRKEDLPVGDLEPSGYVYRLCWVSLQLTFFLLSPMICFFLLCVHVHLHVYVCIIVYAGYVPLYIYVGYVPLYVYAGYVHVFLYVGPICRVCTCTSTLHIYAGYILELDRCYI